LHPDSRECQSIGTPFGVFTPTILLHGTTNATMHMQAIIESIIQDFKPPAETWLDDVATHAKSENEYLDALEQFFGKVQLAGLKLHVHKATLITESINFCGRIVSKNGEQFVPRTLDALQEMPPPATGSELHQYLGATSWMRSSISGVCGACGSFAEVASIDHQQGRCNQASHSKSQAGFTLGRGAPSCFHRYAESIAQPGSHGVSKPRESSLCVR
jgi:hypothetical protein